MSAQPLLRSKGPAHKAYEILRIAGAHTLQVDVGDKRAPDRDCVANRSDVRHIGSLNRPFVGSGYVSLLVAFAVGGLARGEKGAGSLLTAITTLCYYDGRISARIRKDARAWCNRCLAGTTRTSLW